MTQQYQVLARKYRPKNFHELIGQTHVSQALINAIDYNRLHHAYLFTGTRGVGKTTIARILSKCLNCDMGITSTPCGVCDNCVAIDQGRFIDLIEIDAASRTKVEDTRELLDNVPYAPSQGRYKVYLIDEVHMLSTHSFNALLKTLEEPPEHVKFLLATTDPQKLPITIISRCLQFVLRPLSQSLLSEHLANVLIQEQVDYTQPALWQLASAAKGSVRDALSLTDQAIAFGQGALDDATVNAMLGLIDAADLVSLITDIYNHNKPAVAAHIEQMRAQMVDASSMFDGLAELLHQLALCQLLPEVALNVNEAQTQHINQLAQHMSPDVLQLYYEIVVQAREGVKLASTPMQALEMCILRLLAFRPLPVDEILVNVPDSAIQTIEAASTTTESNTGSTNTVEHPMLTPSLGSAPTSELISESEPSPQYDVSDYQAQSEVESYSSSYDNTELSQYGSYGNEEELLANNVSSEPVVEPEPVIEPEPVVEPEPVIEPEPV
ncbi:MAG TPA: DNA polymerase III subunit gamma/tau, partial [Psychrobacter sp.]|nr:DNA polymerase III subunit gamma/tau [Psychrobacter sp.]